MIVEFCQCCGEPLRQIDCMVFHLRRGLIGIDDVYCCKDCSQDFLRYQKELRQVRNERITKWRHEKAQVNRFVQPKHAPKPQR